MLSENDRNRAHALAAEHGPHGGMGLPGLKYVLENAMEAFMLHPEAPVLEIGSFRGQTTVALAILSLSLMGPERATEDASLVVTVDPYGMKFYNSGDSKGQLHYGDSIYQDFKKRLAGLTNHTHFLMTGEEFLIRCVGSTYWRNGKEKLLSGFSFCLLDGEHDTDTVMAELVLLKPAMAEGGRIVIDNVDKDPTLVDRLVAMGADIGPRQPEFGAQQALLVC